jgi:hypothetical protein
VSQKAAGLAVLIAGIVLSGCAPSPVVPTGAAPREVPAAQPAPPPAASTPVLDAGVSAFVVQTLPRTWFAALNASSESACREQLADGQLFFNTLPGVGGNPAPNFGPVGNDFYTEFVPKLRASLGAMELWCTALATETSKITPPSIGSPNFADQMSLAMDALFAVRRNFPRVSDGLNFTASVYCNQATIDSQLSRAVHQGLVFEQEQRLRRLIARDPAFGDAFRQGGRSIEQVSTEFVNDVFGSPNTLGQKLC